MPGIVWCVDFPRQVHATFSLGAPLGKNLDVLFLAESPQYAGSEGDLCGSISAGNGIEGGEKMLLALHDLPMSFKSFQELSALQHLSYTQGIGGSSRLWRSRNEPN